MMKKVYRNNIIDCIHYYKLFTFIVANIIVGIGNILGLSSNKSYSLSLVINTGYNGLVILITVLRFKFVKFDIC